MRNKFTLLELLIVVGIIALLLSILLPSLSRARGKAYTAVCASNQSQVYRGFLLFAKDENGRLPPGARDIFNENVRTTMHSWDDQISQYVGTNLTREELDMGFLPPDREGLEIFSCPADKVDIVRNGKDRTQAAFRSYHVNGFNIWWSGSKNAGLNKLKKNTGVFNQMISRTIAEVETNSTYLLSEGFQGLAGLHGWSAVVNQNNRTDPTNFYTRHYYNSRNYLMVDGSVKFMKNTEIMNIEMVHILK